MFRSRRMDRGHKWVTKFPHGDTKTRDKIEKCHRSKAKYVSCETFCRTQGRISNRKMSASRHEVRAKIRRRILKLGKIKKRDGMKNVFDSA